MKRKIVKKIEKSKLNKIFPERYFFIVIGLPIIFWAFAFPFIKIGLRELSPVNLTIARLFIVCIIFIFFIFIKPKKFQKIQKDDIIPIFLLGFLGVIVYHFGLNYGEQFVSASVASLIIATIPIFIVLMANIFLKEKITFKIAIGIIVSLSGVILISTLGNSEMKIEIQYISGALGVIVAAIVGAGYTVAGKKFLERYSALSLTVYAILFGSIGLIPFLSLSFFKEIYEMSIIGWIAVLFLGIFPTVIGYIFWYIALEIRKASEISVYLYFIPVLSTIISYFWFDERITPFFIIGGFMVITGLFIVNKQEKNQELKIPHR
jgi:drug/metabolite transporter (DMT)-like permease